jgi:hypothetical protein
MVSATLEFREYHSLEANAHAELVAWRVPSPVRGSRHGYKYRFALIVDDVCVMRFDNEAGKGDYRHVGSREFSYDFRGLDRARDDFLVSAREWLAAHAPD